MSTEELKEMKRSAMDTIGIATFALSIIIAVYLAAQNGPLATQEEVGIPEVQEEDLGAILAMGGGLPGYDIDEDGDADYIESGFAHFIKIYNEGGFDYPGGWVYIQELPREDIPGQEIERNITLPSLHFSPSDLAESGVGSVVSFTASEEDSGLEILVIYRTLGRDMNTYTVAITSEAASFRIIDRLGGEGAGIIEVEEIEILGPSIPTF